MIELLIVVAVIGVIAAIAVPNLVQSKVVANEGKAITSVRSLGTAQVTYSTQNGAGSFANDLNALETAGLIDSVLGSGTTGSYMFVVSASGVTFQINARPLVYQTRASVAFLRMSPGSFVITRQMPGQMRAVQVWASKVRDLVVSGRDTKG